MTIRDDRIKDLRIGIIAAQEPLNSRDVWDMPPHEKRALVERVSEQVKKLRAEMNRLIKEREIAREKGEEVDAPVAVAEPARDRILEELNAQFRRT